MAVPTDYAGLLGWHEGNGQSEIAGDPVPTLIGMGGTPNSDTQATSGFRPTLIVNGVTGHKGIRFDATDDTIKLAAATALSARPCSVFIAYKSNSSNAGRRVLAGNSGNWLIGPRSESGAGFTADSIYTGAFVAGPPVDSGRIRVHSLIQPASGSARYRIDSEEIGTSAGTNVPGVISIGIGGFPGEVADADVYALAIYNTEFSDGDAEDLEQGYFADFVEPGANRNTQLLAEPLFEGGLLRKTQLLGEMQYEAGLVRDTQLLKEIALEGGKIRMSQILIELMHRPGGYSYSQII